MIRRSVVARRVLWLVSVLFLACAITAAQNDAQEDWMRAKGIYVERVDSGRARQAAQFFVVVPGNGQRVSTEHQFHSGDRLKFQFALKRSSYVYVLNSTIRSDDAAELHLARSKGIVRVRPDGQAQLPVASGPWRILLPSSTAEPDKTPEGITTDAAVFVMDEDPGLELLTVIVSPSPLDIQRVVTEAVVSDDTRENAIANLQDGSLAVWAANCEVNLAPARGYSPTGSKGIQPEEKESYVIARDSERPFAFQVSLQHLPR